MSAIATLTTTGRTAVIAVHGALEGAQHVDFEQTLEQLHRHDTTLGETRCRTRR